MATGRIYEVDLGDGLPPIRVLRDSIADARQWAKTAFGVRNPRQTTLRGEYRLCEQCGCKPCCCGGVG